MRFRIITVFIAVLNIAIFYTPAHSQNLPKACHEDGMLSTADQNVIHRKRKFERPNNQMYPFETFSVWANDPRDNDRLCLRYEVKNTGTENIEEFRWYDIEQYSGKKIVPNQPRYIRQHEKYSLSDNATDLETEVRAFESSNRLTHAWFTVEKATEQRKVELPKKVGITTFNFEDTMPAVVSALKGASLPIQPIIAFWPPEAAATFGPIHTRITSGKVRFTATTEAKFDGKTFFTTTILSASDMKAVFAPTLLSIRNVYKEPLDEADVRQVISLLPKLVTAAVEKKEGDPAVITLSFSTHEDTELPVLYVVEHPVTILSGNEILCVGISSFSPLPLKVAGEYCNIATFEKRE